MHEYEEVSFTYESIAWNTPPPPGEGLEKGSYSPHTSTDAHVSFEPDWLMEKAKAGFEWVRKTASDIAKAEFDKELKDALAKQPPK